MKMRAAQLLRPVLLLVGAAALTCGGCVLPGEGSRQLTYTPESRQIDYTYRYEQAYAAPSEEGGYDLVLTSGYDMRSPSHGKRVYPAIVPEVGQVVHVHVAWRPARGSKSDYPAATNSSVHWRVVEGRPQATRGTAIYEGVGYVSVEIGEKESLFVLRDVLIKPEAISAGMRDPLGQSRVAGTIRARNNAPAVQEILRQLHAEQTPSTEATATTQPRN